MIWYSQQFELTTGQIFEENVLGGTWSWSEDAQKFTLSSPQHGVADKIHFELAEVDADWQIEDSFFDLAIDSFSSIDIETKVGREKCRDEMYRALKPGAYALVTACSADDEWEKELIANHPGPEPNSTIWPQNGKFQKDYDEAELREFYRAFEIVELKTISKPAFKLSRDGTVTNLWAVLRKH